MMNASVSSGRSVASEPLKARPTGVRTASTMTACGMWTKVLSMYARRSHSTGLLCPAVVARTGEMILDAGVSVWRGARAPARMRDPG